MSSVDAHSAGGPASVETDRLRALTEIQHDISSGAASREQLLAILAARTQALTGADGALVEILEGTDMVSHAGSGLGTQHIGLRLPANRSISGLATRSGMVLVCDDLRTDPRTDLDVYQRLGIESAIVMPLRNGGHFAGVLEVFSGGPHAFGDRDVQTMQMMAGLAGMLVSVQESSWSRGEGENALDLVPQHFLHDRTTGLPTRVVLLDRLRQAITLGRRRNEPVAVLLIDVSELPQRKGSLEKDTAGAVLESLSGQITGTLRASDTVARPSEDEIAVVLAGASAIGALGTAHKILRALGGDARGTASIPSYRPPVGISLYPDHGDDAETLLRHASSALERAHGADDNCAIYDEDNS